MTPERDVELKACPFCNGRGHVEYRSFYHKWQAYCSECHSGTSPSFDRPELAAAAWNRRAALSQGRATTAEGDAELLLPIDRFFIATVEFLNDWKKGDFDLPTLAACDAESIRSHQTAAYHALQNIASALATLQAERDAAVAALRWAMDEIDALAGQACGFAYPQAMPMLGRAGQDMHYVAAVQARRAAALKGDAKPATEER